jgi:hypothetical protein
MRAANLVLYAIAEGVRKPLLSANPSDVNAAVKMQHAASAEFTRAEKSGVPLPEIVCLLEERESNEGGVQISARFTRTNPLTLEAIGRGHSEIADALKAPNNGEVAKSERK